MHIYAYLCRKDRPNAPLLLQSDCWVRRSEWYFSKSAPPSDKYLGCLGSWLGMTCRGKKKGRAKTLTYFDHSGHSGHSRDHSDDHSGDHSDPLRCSPKVHCRCRFEFWCRLPHWPCLATIPGPGKCCGLQECTKWHNAQLKFIKYNHSLSRMLWKEHICIHLPCLSLDISFQHWKAWSPLFALTNLYQATMSWSSGICIILIQQCFLMSKDEAGSSTESTVRHGPVQLLQLRDPLILWLSRLQLDSQKHWGTAPAFFSIRWNDTNPENSKVRHGKRKPMEDHRRPTSYTTLSLGRPRSFSAEDPENGRFGTLGRIAWVSLFPGGCWEIKTSARPGSPS